MHSEKSSEQKTSRNFWKVPECSGGCFYRYYRHLSIKADPHAVEFLTYAVSTLVDNCITGITANRECCKSMVDHSVGIITALTPHIGYEHAAQIAKGAIRTGASVRELILEKGILDKERLDKILDPFAMTTPGISARELLDSQSYSKNFTM